MRRLRTTALAIAAVAGLSALAWAADAPKAPAGGNNAALVAQNVPPSTPAPHAMQAMNGPQEAVAVLEPSKGSKVAGTLVFTQKNDGVEVTGEITGLEPGEHGFHIHEFGDLRSTDGSSAGPHFDPGHMHHHGGPDSPSHHAGDLGNIKADASGKAMVNTEGKGLHVVALLGRGIVVHAKADDLKTDPSGDSGARIAVGVIGAAQVKTSATSAPAKTGAPAPK